MALASVFHGKGCEIFVFPSKVGQREELGAERAYYSLARTIPCHEEPQDGLNASRTFLWGRFRMILQRALSSLGMPAAHTLPTMLPSALSSAPTWTEQPKPAPLGGLSTISQVSSTGQPPSQMALPQFPTAFMQAPAARALPPQAPALPTQASAAPLAPALPPQVAALPQPAAFGGTITPQVQPAFPSPATPPVPLPPTVAESKSTTLTMIPTGPTVSGCTASAVKGGGCWLRGGPCSHAATDCESDQESMQSHLPCVWGGRGASYAMDR